MQHVDERPTDPLTLEIYAPESEGSYEIHDEDRPDVPVRYRREEGEAGDVLSGEIGAAPGRVELVVYGIEVSEARLDGASQPLDRTGDGGAVVRFDGTAPREVPLRLAGA